jgi:hypothetical protein
MGPRRTIIELNVLVQIIFLENPSAPSAADLVKSAGLKRLAQLFCDLGPKLNPRTDTDADTVPVIR